MGCSTSPKPIPREAKLCLLPVPPRHMAALCTGKGLRQLEAVLNLHSPKQEGLELSASIMLIHLSCQPHDTVTLPLSSCAAHPRVRPLSLCPWGGSGCRMSGVNPWGIPATAGDLVKPAEFIPGGRELTLGAGASPSPALQPDSTSQAVPAFPGASADPQQSDCPIAT